MSFIGSRMPIKWRNPKPLMRQSSTSSTEIKKSNALPAASVELRCTHGKGWGVFAKKNFAKSDLVMASNCLEVRSWSDSHSIQTGGELHVKMDLPARFVNHRCGDANVGIQLNDWNSYDFYALREILEDEEILWDYETAEYELSNKFHCFCGSKICRGRLRGFRFHGEDVVRAYGTKWIAPYLLKVK